MSRPVQQLFLCMALSVPVCHSVCCEAGVNHVTLPDSPHTRQCCSKGHRWTASSKHRSTQHGRQQDRCGQKSLVLPNWLHCIVTAITLRVCVTRCGYRRPLSTQHGVSPELAFCTEGRWQHWLTPCSPHSTQPHSLRAAHKSLRVLRVESVAPHPITLAVANLCT